MHIITTDPVQSEISHSAKTKQSNQPNGNAKSVEQQRFDMNFANQNVCR